MSIDALATELILGEIRREREARHAKWGEQNHPDGTGIDWAPMVVPAFGTADGYTPAAHTARLAKLLCKRASRAGGDTWLKVLLEEVAAAFAETDPAKLRAKLVQVAAVATAWVEAIDRRPGGAS